MRPHRLEAGVKNKTSLPAGTKYSWQEKPDTTKVGETRGMVTVSYPDKTKDLLIVSVLVDAKDTSVLQQDNVPSSSQMAVHQTSKEALAKVLPNSKEKIKELSSTTLLPKNVQKAQLPQTGEAKSNHLVLLGEVFILSAFFWGYGAPKKKDENK